VPYSHDQLQGFQLHPVDDHGGGQPARSTLIRVLLAQDRTLIRGALVALLGQEADIDVVADVAELGEVVPAARRCRPDLVILDLDLVDTDHLSTLAALTRALPGDGLLVLTDVRQSALLATAVARELPQVGFLSKQAPPARLVEAVRKLANGEPTLDPQLAVAALTGRGNPLTAREREVLLLAAAGAPAKEIAARLFLATGTVRNYLSSSMGKTGGRTRIEAIRIAQEAGWL
jgi:two-component system, NarL family, response regulator DesR